MCKTDLLEGIANFILIRLFFASVIREKPREVHQYHPSYKCNGWHSTGASVTDYRRVRPAIRGGVDPLLVISEAAGPIVKKQTAFDSLA